MTHETTSKAPLPDGSGIGAYVRVGWRPALKDGGHGRLQWRWALAVPQTPIQAPRATRSFFLCNKQGETDRNGKREMLLVLSSELQIKPARMNLTYGSLELRPNR